MCFAAINIDFVCSSINLNDNLFGLLRVAKLQRVRCLDWGGTVSQLLTSALVEDILETKIQNNLSLHFQSQFYK